MPLLQILKYILISCVCIIPMMKCERVDGLTKEPPKEAMTNEWYNLDSNQIKNLSDSAQKGSGEAALKLANYFEYYQKNRKKSLSWFTISAEKGNAMGQYNLAFYMLNDNLNTIGGKDARYWLNQASKQGFKQADTLLIKLSGIK
jgi:TPR repeat protein